MRDVQSWLVLAPQYHRQKWPPGVGGVPNIPSAPRPNAWRHCSWSNARAKVSVLAGEARHQPFREPLLVGRLLGEGSEEDEVGGGNDSGHARRLEPRRHQTGPLVP